MQIPQSESPASCPARGEWIKIMYLKACFYGHSLKTITIYGALKHLCVNNNDAVCLSTITIYRALKLQAGQRQEQVCLRTITIYRALKHTVRSSESTYRFENYYNLQGSQTHRRPLWARTSLRTITIYRALKRHNSDHSGHRGLRTITIYRALKRSSACIPYQ